MATLGEAIALFDLDGTLADYDEAMYREIEAIKSPEETWTCRPHAILEPWMEARIKLIRGKPGFWSELEPLPAGFAVLAIAKELDFECIALTKGPDSHPRAWAEKKEWADIYLPDDKLIIADAKQLVEGAALVEDWPGYYEPWLELHPLGQVVVMKQPWNEGHHDHDRIVVCDGTEESLARVRERLTRVRTSIRKLGHL